MAVVVQAGATPASTSSNRGEGDDASRSENLTFFDAPLPAEDIIALPRTQWAVTSSMATAAHSGGLNLINSRTKISTPLWPAEGDFEYVPDQNAFPGCEAVPDAHRPATHGINAVQTGPRTFDLYVVYHGSRESIEVFSVDVRGTAPTASWRGCVEVPEGTSANGVAVLPDGGIAITNPYDRSQPVLPQLFSGQPSGQIWTWHRETGWSEVVGSDMHFPNGIEVSDDGATLYVAETAPTNSAIVSIPTAGGPQRVLARTTSFLPDNLRWTRSGTLLTTGVSYNVLPSEPTELCGFQPTPPNFCVRGFHIFEINTATGTSHTVFSTNAEEFWYPTVAAPVGRDVWVGGTGTATIAVLSGRGHGPQS